MVLYSTQYHWQHNIPQGPGFEQFEVLYMHNLDDKYPTPGGIRAQYHWFSSHNRIEGAIGAG